MSLSIPDVISNGGTTSIDPQGQRDEATLRQVAQQFEALLLNQLTASLNPRDDDEDGMFGSTGGMGLSRQMFSEQIASAMAQNGGIGLTDFILTQFRQNRSGGATNNPATLTANALRTIRDVSLDPVRADSATSGTAPKASPAAAPAPADNSSVPATNTKARPQHTDVTRLTRPRRVHAATPVPVTEVARLGSLTSEDRLGTKVRRQAVTFRSPVQGPLRSFFGPRRDPINGRHRFHQGIDIAVPLGTPVSAAAAGKVVFAGRNGGYGNMVLIEHSDGRRTLYGHNQSLLVKAGDVVQAGQPIAAAGSTGHSTGPHVHFEIREGNNSVNPLNFLINDFKLTRR